MCKAVIFNCINTISITTKKVQLRTSAELKPKQKQNHFIQSVLLRSKYAFPINLICHFLNLFLILVLRWICIKNDKLDYVIKHQTTTENNNISAKNL